jgi:hypothetical protein
VGELLCFSRKRQKSYDKQNQKPAIKASICNGEVVAGFIDLTNWQSLIWREQLSKDSCSFFKLALLLPGFVSFLDLCDSF